MAAEKVKGSGTREQPWVLKTPPRSSEYTAFRDETGNPPALVVQVGKRGHRLGFTGAGSALRSGANAT